MTEEMTTVTVKTSLKLPRDVPRQATNLKQNRVKVPLMPFVTTKV